MITKITAAMIIIRKVAIHARRENIQLHPFKAKHGNHAFWLTWKERNKTKLLQLSVLGKELFQGHVRV